MKFNIINIRQNDLGATLRIDTGIVSFDVRIHKENEKYIVSKPSGIYFPNTIDYNNFIGVVINTYKNAISSENVINEYKKENT